MRNLLQKCFKWQWLFCFGVGGLLFVGPLACLLGCRLLLFVL